VRDGGEAVVNRVLRIRDVARELGVSTKTVHRWIDAGKLTATRLPSGHWRVHESAILELLIERRRADEAAFHSG
jgi:excisionase family DNA binding protein